MDIWAIIIVFALILGSTILHELAHGLVALALGDDTAKISGRLTLNPVKHIDPIMSLAVPLILFISGGPVFGAAKPVPVDKRNLKFGEWGMALVALAGPFTNFLIALVAFLIGHFTGLLYTGGYGGLIFTQLVVINLGFMLFNLIPIVPLDGSRVLYAIAPDGVRRVMLQLEGPLGLVVIYVMIFAFSGFFSELMVNGINGVLQFFSLLVGL